MNQQNRGEVTGRYWLIINFLLLFFPAKTYKRYQQACNKSRYGIKP
jgi:hypothetical protein